MRCVAALIGACLLSASIAAQPSARVTTTPVAIPSFDSERGIQWSSSRAEYDAAQRDARHVLEQFTYVSDGLTVGAYLYRPVAAPTQPRPVVVYNRGSAARPSGFAGELLVMAHRFAEAGFTVVAPHYRGSNGWAGRDEMGGAELADLINLLPVLRRIEGVDASRLFLAGESRGGMMVYQALRDGVPAKAAAVWGAFTDLDAVIAQGPAQEAQARQLWPTLASEREAIVEPRSALRWASRIDVPVLIMHGSADEDMPISHSQRMDAELTRLGKVHELRVFEGEQHRIGGRGAERDAAAVAWFRRFDK